MKCLEHIPLLFLFSMLFVLGSVQAQTYNDSLVQFTGLVLDGSDERLLPIALTNISVRGKSRGTYTDFDGFFSIVVQKGDLVEFTAIGYRSVEFAIPDTLRDDRYSLVQLMTQDTINLPETVVFPWPSKDHFRLEFLAMDVTSDLEERAAENLAEKTLEELRYSVPSDGNEHADYYLRQQARSNYYIGQTPPMNIFNPIAWKKFFDAWKRGDFKKKDEN